MKTAPNKDKHYSVKILVCYHKKDKLYKNDVLIPIHAGRKVAFEKSKDGSISKEDYNWLIKNTIGDDTGDNISELNREINEWSAIYWAWKNYEKLGNPDYIGLCHYRRLFDFRKLIKTKGFSVLDKLGNNKKAINKLLKNYEVIYRKGFQITDKTAHNFEFWQQMVNLSSEYHPILFEQYQKFKNEQIFYPNNIFLMKKEVFFNMCEEIFPVIFDLVKKPNDEVTELFLNYVKSTCSKENYNTKKKIIQENNNRYPRTTSYMAEYLSSFYFMYLRDKYNERAVECDIVNPNDFKSKHLPIQKIFSVKNEYNNNVKRKVITLFGIKFKIKDKQYKAIPVLPRLEVHLCDHCNLNCRGCTHFCNVAQEKYLDINTYIKDLEEINKKISFKEIKLLGGEPLLHPDVHKFILETRRLCPNTKIVFISNCILLDRASDEFWNAMKTTGTYFNLSKYPPMNDKISHYLDVISAHGVRLGDIHVANEFWLIRNPKGDSNPEHVYQNCNDAFCRQYRNSRLYICPDACYMDYYNEYFSKNIPIDEGIDIYNHTSEEIYKYLTAPKETCKYCVARENYKIVPWEQSKKNENEWNAVEETEERQHINGRKD